MLLLPLWQFSGASFEDHWSKRNHWDLVPCKLIQPEAGDSILHGIQSRRLGNLCLFRLSFFFFFFFFYSNVLWITNELLFLKCPAQSIWGENGNRLEVIKIRPPRKLPCGAGLRIRRCHGAGADCNCGGGASAGLRTSTGHAPKKKKTKIK